jgi:hypothetical protein
VISQEFEPVVIIEEGRQEPDRNLGGRAGVQPVGHEAGGERQVAGWPDEVHGPHPAEGRDPVLLDNGEPVRVLVEMGQIPPGRLELGPTEVGDEKVLLEPGVEIAGGEVSDEEVGRFRDDVQGDSSPAPT